MDQDLSVFLLHFREAVKLRLTLQYFEVHGKSRKAQLVTNIFFLDNSKENICTRKKNICTFLCLPFPVQIVFLWWCWSCLTPSGRRRRHLIWGMNLGVQGILLVGTRDPRHLQGAKFMNRALGISSLDLDATAKSLKGLGKRSHFIWEKRYFENCKSGA